MDVRNHEAHTASAELSRRKVLRGLGVGIGMIPLSGLIGCTNVLETRVKQSETMNQLSVSAHSASPWTIIRKGNAQLRLRKLKPNNKIYGLDIHFRANEGNMIIKHRANPGHAFLDIQLPKNDKVKIDLKGNAKTFQNWNSPAPADLQSKSQVLSIYEQLIQAFGENKLNRLHETFEVNNVAINVPSYRMNYVDNPNREELKKPGLFLAEELSNSSKGILERYAEFIDDNVIENINKKMKNHTLESRGKSPDECLQSPGASPNCGSGGGDDGSSSGGGGGSECIDDCAGAAISTATAVASLTACSTLAGCAWSYLGVKGAQIAIIGCAACLS